MWLKETLRLDKELRGGKKSEMSRTRSLKTKSRGGAQAEGTDLTRNRERNCNFFGKHNDSRGWGELGLVLGRGRDWQSGKNILWTVRLTWKIRAGNASRLPLR